MYGGWFFVWKCVLFHIFYVENWGTGKLSDLPRLHSWGSQGLFLSLMLSLLQQQTRCLRLGALSQPYPESFSPDPVWPQGYLPGHVLWLKDLIRIHLNMRNNVLKHCILWVCLNVRHKVTFKSSYEFWKKKIHWGHETQKLFTLGMVLLSPQGPHRPTMTFLVICSLVEKQYHVP